jgi:hypothetical protein
VTENKGRKNYEKVKSVKEKELAAKNWEECDSKGVGRMVGGESSTSWQRIAQSREKVKGTGIIR